MAGRARAPPQGAADRPSLALGLPGGPHNVLRKDDIPANRVVLLRDHEAQAISAAAGVPVPVLHAMTMARYDGRAIMIDHASRRVSLRAIWGRGRGSRYCPGCLADTGGRWQLRWRLTWSFACTTHQRLLADTCPACDSIPGFRASDSHLPPSPGYCEAPIPYQGKAGGQAGAATSAAGPTSPGPLPCRYRQGTRSWPPSRSSTSLLTLTPPTSDSTQPRRRLSPRWPTCARSRAASSPTPCTARFPAT